jgi:rhodanese-related sulfurtransferase
VRRFTKKRGGEIDGEKYFNERSSKKGNKYEKTLILDVRNTDAFDDWKIEGGQVEVINESYSNLLEGIDPAAEKLQKDQEIIVTCAKGRSSEMVADTLVKAGFVGAGGSFLLVPIMLVVLKFPTRMTIASSLAITFISSIGSTIGKISTEQVEYGPAFIMIVASLVASPLGAGVGKRVNTKVLQIILALLILATAVKTWIEIL